MHWFSRKVFIRKITYTSYQVIFLNFLVFILRIFQVFSLLVFTTGRPFLVSIRLGFILTRQSSSFKIQLKFFFNSLKY